MGQAKCCHPAAGRGRELPSGDCSLIWRPRVMTPMRVMGTPAMVEGMFGCTRSRNGEEEFVVFAAVEGVAGSVVSASVVRESGGFDHGADAAFVAEVAEVGGEAVGGVDHGGGEFLLAQVAADGEARVGIEVAGMLRWAWSFLPSRSASRVATDEPRVPVTKMSVADMGAGAEDGFAGGDAADDDDVGEDAVGGLGGVASGEGD